MNQETNEQELPKQPLTEHLSELRERLIKSLGGVAAGFALCYAWSKELAEWLFAPLAQVMPQGSSLIFTSYQEGFFFT